MRSSVSVPAWLRDPWSVVELFAAANLGFLALDIYVAHSINAFAHPAEWVPFVFSVIAPVSLALDWLGCRLRRPAWRLLGFGVGWASIFTGIVGLSLHLDSQFFEAWTFQSLVYTAPFAAPLSYTGLGLLVLLNRSMDATDPRWWRWVVALALGGFLGNFALSWADHAQNGFFYPSEWVPVVASAIAIGFLLAILLFPDDRLVRPITQGVLAGQVLVGVTGFALHGWTNLHGPASWWSNFVFGAPVFAPLLFVDLAILAAIGLWAKSHAKRDRSS